MPDTSAESATQPAATPDLSDPRVKGEDVLDLTDIISALEALAELDVHPGVPVELEDPEQEPAEDAEVAPPPVTPAALACDTAALAAQLHHADSSWLDALLDAAMRRRFVFLSMDTGEPALTGVLARWCVDNGRAPGLASLRDRLNAEMRRHGLESSLALGPSYFMRPGLDTPQGLDRLWRRELRPMLVEHHYGDHDKVDGWYPFRAWTHEYGLPGAVAADGTTGEAG